MFTAATGKHALDMIAELCLRIAIDGYQPCPHYGRHPEFCERVIQLIYQRFANHYI